MCVLCPLAQFNQIFIIVFQVNRISYLPIPVHEDSHALKPVP